MTQSRKTWLLLRAIGLSLFVLLLPAIALAATGGALEFVDLTGHWAGVLSLVIFVAAYSLVIGEEVIHMRKAKPVIVAAGLIWVLVAIAFMQAGDMERAHVEVRGDLLEFVELFLFLLAAMTFINTMEERGVFDVLRVWLVTRDFSLRQIFWITGGLSSFLDNAPTYLTFFNTQLGRFYPGVPEVQAVPRLIAEHGNFLKALSVGAVFMGANTYIGNAPNFMVKAIAEEAGVAMPSFFGYLIRWALPILIPVFLLISLVFF